MIQGLNALFKTVYCTLISTTTLYIVTDVYAHNFIKIRYGRVPTNQELFDISKTSILTLQSFPIKNSEFTLDIFFSAFLILPLLFLANYISYKYLKNVEFHKLLSIILSAVFIIAYIMDLMWIGYQFVGRIHEEIPQPCAYTNNAVNQSGRFYS